MAEKIEGVDYMKAASVQDLVNVSDAMQRQIDHLVERLGMPLRESEPFDKTRILGNTLDRLRALENQAGLIDEDGFRFEAKLKPEPAPEKSDAQKLTFIWDACQSNDDSDALSLSARILDIMDACEWPHKSARYIPVSERQEPPKPEPCDTCGH